MMKKISKEVAKAQNIFLQWKEESHFKQGALKKYQALTICVFVFLLVKRQENFNPRKLRANIFHIIAIMHAHYEEKRVRAFETFFSPSLLMKAQQKILIELCLISLLAKVNMKRDGNEKEEVVEGKK